MTEFPVRSYMRFLENHKLLNFIDRPQWRTVTGGSREYVSKIIAAIGAKAHKSTHIRGLHRVPGGVILNIQGEGEVFFDKVILAAHADQSLGLIDDASTLERDILSCFKFQPNRAVLHSDPRLMPRRKSAWASWNYVTGSDHDGGLCLSYWMNRLQSIDKAYPLYETLNPHIEPDPALIHGEFSYDHPLFDAKAIAAQTRLGEIQGLNNLYFAGAWTGYGFHEDGLKSAIAIARSLKMTIPWQTEVAAYPLHVSSLHDDGEREIA